MWQNHLVAATIHNVSDHGKHKVALVVNEIGEIPVDGKIIEESGMRMKDIGGGCYLLRGGGLIREDFICAI